MKQKLTNLTNVAKEKAHAAWNALEESPVWVRSAVSLTVGLGVYCGAATVGTWIYTSLMSMSTVAAVLFALAWIVLMTMLFFWALGLYATQRYSTASIKDMFLNPTKTLFTGLDS